MSLARSLAMELEFKDVCFSIGETRVQARARGEIKQISSRYLPLDRYIYPESFEVIADGTTYIFENRYTLGAFLFELDGYTRLNNVPVISTSGFTQFLYPHVEEIREIVNAVRTIVDLGGVEQAILDTDRLFVLHEPRTAIWIEDAIAMRKKLERWNSREVASFVSCQPVWSRDRLLDARAAFF